MSEDSGPAKTFKITTYNVQNWGVTDRIIEGKRVPQAMKPEKEQQAVINILKSIQPDILGVEEILQDPEDKYIKHFLETLAKNGLNYPHTFSIKGNDPRIQTLLLSRYPIEEKGALNLDSYEVTRRSGGKNSTETRKVERGITHAGIRVTPDYRIDVLLVHLKSKRNDPSLNDSKTQEEGQQIIRRNEATVMRSHIDRLLQENPNRNLVAMGDFNDELSTPAIKIIQGSKGQPKLWWMWRGDYHGDLWSHFYYPLKSYSRIDHIFMSDGARNELVPEQSFVYREPAGSPDSVWWSTASDHRAVTATFSVEERQSPSWKDDQP